LLVHTTWIIWLLLVAGQVEMVFQIPPEQQAEVVLEVW
jgi:hypothetical protein